MRNKVNDLSAQLDLIKKRGGNKQCFDCGEKGTTYAVMNFGTFVCSRCAGLLRELNYKVKGTGVSIFTEKEISALEAMGNDNAKKIWMAKFREDRNRLPNSKNSDEIKKHLVEKYNEKRYYKKEKKSKNKKKEKEKEESSSEEEKESDDEKDSSENSEEDESEKKKADKKHEERSNYNKKEENNNSKKNIPKIDIKHPSDTRNMHKGKDNSKKNNDITDQFEFIDDSKPNTNINTTNNKKQDEIWNIWDNQPKNLTTTTNTISNNQPNVVFDFTNLSAPKQQEPNPNIPYDNPLPPNNDPNQPKTMNINDLTNALNNLNTNAMKGSNYPNTNPYMSMGNGMTMSNMGMPAMNNGMGNGMGQMNPLMMGLANMTPQQQQQMMMYMYQMMNNQMNFGSNNPNPNPNYVPNPYSFTPSNNPPSSMNNNNNNSFNF